MRVVLYSSIDGEPITVIDVPAHLIEHAKKHRFFSVPVIMPLTYDELANNDVLFDAPKIIDIEVRSVKWPDGQEQLLLYTANEELALLHRAEFLAGQLKSVQLQYKKGFSAGFLEALKKLSSF